MAATSPFVQYTTQQQADPYASSLQQLMDSMNQGSYPGYTISGGSNITRVSPQEEAAANQTAFGGLDMNNFGMVPEDQLSGYYALSQPYMFGQGMENIDQILASSGYGVGGSQSGNVQGGFEGARAEMGGRLQASLGSQIANMLSQNAQTGAQARSQAQLGIGQSRYGALTRPNATSTNVTKGPGVGSASVQQGGSTIGTGDNSYAGAGGAGGAGGGAGSRSGGGAGAAGGAGAGTDWWGQTSYGAANGGAGAAWNASQPGYYGTGDQAAANYWNQNGYAGLNSTGVQSPESQYFTPESGGSGPAGAGTQPNADEMGWIAVEGPHESYWGTKAAADANTAKGYKSTWTPR